MKAFFRTLLAVIVGILLCNFLVLAFFIGLAAAIGSDEEITVKKQSVLRIDLSTPIVDRAVTDVKSQIDWETMTLSSRLELYPTMEAIRHAAHDDKIEGISIEADGFSIGIAQAEELRAELERFKESGKFIYAYADTYSQMAYWLSSVADSVFLNPAGGFAWQGLAAQMIYYKNAMAKYGVEPQVVRHGKFKSAVEPFLENSMSAANYEQTYTFLNSIWLHLTQMVSQARGIDTDELNRIADELIIVEPQEARELGLVDALYYTDQYDSLLVARCGTDVEKKPRTIDLEKYCEHAKGAIKLDLKAPKIAVVYAQGNIIDGDKTNTDIQGAGYSQVFADLRRDSTIKAVVLRVNSPGGSALASDIMWRELERLKAVKPLIVSMGNYAASGGYYMSSPADYIVSGPLTLTGSIGVFGLFFTFGKLAKDIIGVSPQVVKTNAHSDMGSIYRPLDATEQKALQNSVENVYSVFLDRVSTGRGMTTAAVDSIGQGRVWCGVDAKEIGLVDELGGLYRAIEVAAERAGLDKYRISSYPKTDENSFDAIITKMLSNRSVAQLIAKSKADPLAEMKEQIETIVSQQGVRAQMPYFINIK